MTAVKTTIADAKPSKTYVTPSGKLTDRPQLPLTLNALQFLVTARGKSDQDIHGRLTAALREVKSNDLVLMLERIMLSVGDVSRQHNILKELGIKSETGGSQERQVFRSVLRWWAANLPESFAKNLRVFVEFTNYENLWFFQNTTDRNTGRLTGTEVFLPMPSVVHAFIAQQIRAGRDLQLIAKQLPSLTNGAMRTQKKVVKSINRFDEFSLASLKLPETAWVKVNGNIVSKDSNVNAGDVVSWPRAKQSFSLEKQLKITAWVKGLCEVMGWSANDYNEFRSTQDTPEQKFASQSIRTMAKSEFMKFMDQLSGGQRHRVTHSIAYKDEQGNLQPQAKWDNLGVWYIEWEANQTKVADKLRTLATQETVRDTTDEKATLMKQFKTKVTGKGTVDILLDMFEGRKTDEQINNNYQMLLEKMDLIANVFPVVDGSGSMDQALRLENGQRLSPRQIVYAMAIAFSTRNPVAHFRNTFGWFSHQFHIVGNSNYVDERPNQFVSRQSFVKQVPRYNVLSETKTFTENFKSMKEADPNDVSSTNPMAVVEHFVALVKKGLCHVEDLPQALLYLTDNEFNTGLTVKEGAELARSIGWNPLQVFWGITGINPAIEKMISSLPNALMVSGFNESKLSQVLRGIKSGSIDVEDELWAMYEDKRYSVLQ